MELVGRIGQSFLVSFLLLLGVSRIFGDIPGTKRALAGALTGCACTAAGILSGDLWLGRGGWTMAAICGAALTGTTRLRQGGAFALLALAMEGAAGAVRAGNGEMLLLAGALTLAGGNEKTAPVILPVELNYRDRVWHLKALLDTGNQLRDPVTGEPVMVAEAELARQLLGLSQQQLRHPAETMLTGEIPGLRLIPYHTVGQEKAMMLAVRIPEIVLGSRKGSGLVAFAPECFGRGTTYQMLAGGMLT